MTPSPPLAPQNGNQDVPDMAVPRESQPRRTFHSGPRPTRAECIAAAARILAEIRTEMAITAARNEKGPNA